MSRDLEKITPYDDARKKKEQVSRMFDNIAPYYDLLNRVLSAGIDKNWRKKTVREVLRTKPENVLDLATGTADLAINIAERSSHPIKITGLDISPKMLDKGRQKLKKKGLEKKVELIHGDGENLPFEENSFDAVCIAFGIRNYGNMEKGLQEMHRVLRPGGKAVILEFSKPTAPVISQLYNFYFRNLLPFIGRMTSKDSRAYSYLYESVQAFPDYEEFLETMEKSGFSRARYDKLTFGISTIYSAEK